MRGRIPHIERAIRTMPWAIVPEKLEAIIDLVERRALGEEAALAEVEAAIRSAPLRNGNGRAGQTAILPLYGTITQRANLLSQFSGGTSTEAFRAMFRQAVNDPSVKAILIDVDSPGGTIYGVEELSSEIFRARGAKPIVAIANSLAASAAYWIATAADEVVVTPTGEVGSIGVFAAHEDWSGLEQKIGVKTSLISAGKYKTEGSPYGPLTSTARAAMQKRVDEYYSMFVRRVAINRRSTSTDVRNGFGQGRVVGADQAVKLGMADRVGTLGQTLMRLGGAAH